MQKSYKTQKLPYSSGEPLTSDLLKRRCDPQLLERRVFENQNEEIPTPIGQKRAIEALQFGLDIQGRGYNIFVMGPPGSGKTSTVVRLLEERAASEPPPDELCFVYNFSDPSRPKPLLVPAGTSKKLKKELPSTILGLSKSLFHTLYDSHFLQRAAIVRAESEREINKIFTEIDKIARKHNLLLERERDQFLVVPLIDGKPIEPDVYENLSLEEQEDLQNQIADFQRESAPWIKAQRDQERAIEEKIARLEQREIEGLVENTFQALKDLFSDSGENLLLFFDEMKNYLMENYHSLLSPENEEEQQKENSSSKDSPEVPLPYQINFLVEVSSQGAPIIVEKEPTIPHLFGFLEYKESHEGLITDHMSVRAGSLHRANGGYLVLQANDMLLHPDVWSDLKRALKHKEIRLRDLSMDPDKPRIHGTIRPLEAPLNLKIVLVGSPEAYYLLMHEDDDFARVFKVKAEFESWIPRNPDNELKYCAFLKRICQEEKLLPPNSSAMALMIEESSREVEAQDKLSTSLVSTIDLLYEADYWARKRQSEHIESQDIKKALDFRAYRHESLEKNIMESIDKGEMLIDTDGFEVGQINGLLVYLVMDHSFGVPSKITARTYVGKSGVLNIDREAKLSGVIHDKGSMILVGFLGSLFAQKHPLSFNASITFEQNYGEIEGDSASCAEFYALLSSLADVPIYQGIAVTGSINQQGLLQPIGAVNEKIEGMFKICQSRGLTGKQGVIIPIQNVDHLMLRDDVIEAVEKGLFHIWPIEHVFDGIEILMNIPSGSLQEDGSWTPHSLLDRVQKRIDHFHSLIKNKEL